MLKVIIAAATITLMAGCATGPKESPYAWQEKISPCVAIDHAMSDIDWHKIHGRISSYTGPTVDDAQSTIAKNTAACRTRPDSEWPQQWQKTAREETARLLAAKYAAEAKAEAELKRKNDAAAKLAEQRAAAIEKIEGPRRKAREEKAQKDFEKKWTDDLIADWNKQRAKGLLYIGIDSSRVDKSCWGRPESINRTVNPWGVSEQWVYRGGYLYFTNNKLTSIQTLGRHICVVN
jgi:hypothetical protein